MQTRNPIIKTFSLLGDFLRQFPEASRSSSQKLAVLEKTRYEEFLKLMESEHIYNPWFTRDFILTSLRGISIMLQPEVLDRWLGAYELANHSPGQEKTVGLVLAGNIPLVGFHDLMCVLVAGHKVLVKPSSKDDRLIRKVAELLIELDSLMEGRITFTDEKLSGMDAIIATGSNNSARYFEYYFRDMPHIIRKNRNGVAVLTGFESEEELYRVGEDIFTYFGLGCRNVTKLYIPEDYDLKILLGVLDRFHPLYQHHKYSNNVDYYRTIFLMNRDPILDNEILLLKEDSAIASPVGVVYYERYSELGWVLNQLNSRKQEIQCVVSIDPGIKDALPPGTSQQPMPWDYADGVDTLRFLMELN